MLILTLRDDKVWKPLISSIIITFLVEVKAGGEGWLLQSEQLPSDTRLIPGIGNGHVATQVYSDTIYISNVYNGYTNSTHRARIPSTVGITVTKDDLIDRNYTLDMRRGDQLSFAASVISSLFIAHFLGEDYTIEQWLYAHRTRSRILVCDVTVSRHGDGTPGDVEIRLELNRGDPSEDVNLTTVEYNTTTYYTTGPILEPETETSDIPVVHQFWTKVPYSVVLPASESTQTWRFLTALSTDLNDALAEYESAINSGTSELQQEHITAWESLWSDSDIVVLNYEGGYEFQETFRAALFHIMISTPDQVDVINPFGGLSPGTAAAVGGLARGGKLNNGSSADNDYLGHVFWDMDTWIMPAILMFHPDKAKLMIDSRLRVINATRDNAIGSGYRGVRYPWEQAYTGYETCPWDLAALYQIHITADVSYAIRQYLYTTEDVHFVVNGGGKELVMEIARFWESRSVLRDDDKGYEILGVMGPDENSANVNNSVFTNYNAKLSLSLPQYLRDKLGISYTPDELEEVASFNEVSSNIYIPFDDEIQFHPQYDDFDYISKR
ncbi:hypothetical protein LSH36_1090g00111 [Paralvinella palmiformis]|uniref:Glycoside hydrolase family 65 central catalytic domain-containing protein n=1 Tax=Paralvinella palmiformis TaxID=53620 RepID=A0AAD9IVN2_9ANNE|nr:hypothetical protein LSH36_1090g00111 [Paralvinella palmiformis]